MIPRQLDSYGKNNEARTLPPTTLKKLSQNESEQNVKKENHKILRRHRTKSL